MNDEQFQKMYAVELAKLAALQGIMSLVQAIAVALEAVITGELSKGWRVARLPIAPQQASVPRSSSYMPA